MRTDCSDDQLEFEAFGRRQVVAGFDAGATSSDGGALLLLREVIARSGMLGRLAACFDDFRDPARIEHSVEQMLSQRVLALACGNEDLNDHDELRDDPLLAMACGKRDPTGQDRVRARDRGHALAGKSTLNRLELTAAVTGPADRYKKIRADDRALEQWFVDEFLRAHTHAPESIVLDLDATDDPLHGDQEGRFFHGYYRAYCYLPLYMTCGDFLLVSKLRTANADGAAGALEEVARVVAHIRSAWPSTQITVRADSGFARDALMGWCEAHGVDYVLGLARNARLVDAIEDALAEVAERHAETGRPERTYKDLRYRTLKTWSAERRVVGKAEQLRGKRNPRFVVTSLAEETIDARALYEDLYCARGDMENRIKEQQLDLFADRTSAGTMRANQLRLWFSSAAYVLVNELRRVGLAGTEMARAQVGTIRTRLGKIAAIVVVSVRRVRVALSSSYPRQGLFAIVLRNVQAYRYPLRL